MNADSVDKIVNGYFAAVTRQSFTYKGRSYAPMPLVVSPFIWRGYTCPSHCGGCCGVFTLDWLPMEDQPEVTDIRYVELSGVPRLIHTQYPDKAAAERPDKCHQLRVSDGRCKIHSHHPFTCDFELTRVFHPGERGKFFMRTQLYGRGWNMKRTDGLRGAKCTITEADSISWRDTLRKLRRLKLWTDYFGLDTRIPEILQWGAAGPTLEPLLFDQ